MRGKSGGLVSNRSSFFLSLLLLFIFVLVINGIPFFLDFKGRREEISVVTYSIILLEDLNVMGINIEIIHSGTILEYQPFFALTITNLSSLVSISFLFQKLVLSGNTFGHQPTLRISSSLNICWECFYLMLSFMVLWPGM